MNPDPLILHPPSGGSTDPNQAENPGKMTANATKVIGFSVAALALIGLSRIYPSGAVALTAVIVLGVVLTQNEQVTTLINGYVDAVGGNK